MKAVQFKEYGGPEVLGIVEVEEPHPSAGEIRIAVRAAAVNVPDWKIREGKLQHVFPRTLPSGVGFEASGIVDEVGEGVCDVEVGDAVFGKGVDTFAERAVLTSWARKPDGMTFEEAAAAPNAGETALRILSLMDVRAGQTLLVSGAAGGVGTATIQLARRLGAIVIGTASPDQQDYLRSFGVAPVVYGLGLVQRVRALAPNGIDAAFDIVGSGVIDDLVELTGDPQRVLTIVISEAGKGGGIKSSFQVVDRPEVALQELATAFEEGKFRMHVQKVFPLEETAAAQALVAQGQTSGRVVVSIPVV